jgi:hypothetical protein
MERSEASVTSSIWRAREVERGVGSGVPRGGGRKRERWGYAGSAAGSRGQNGSRQCGRRRQCALTARAVANRRGRWGVGNMVRRD